MTITFMSLQKFTVLIERDEDGMYIAKIPDLPGCHTQAKTLKQLDKRIREAASLCLEVLKADKIPVVRSKLIDIKELEVNV